MATVARFAFLIALLCPMQLLWAQPQISDTDSRPTPLDLKALDRLPNERLADETLSGVDAAAIQALLSQFNSENVNSLRAHQRAFRRSLQNSNRTVSDKSVSNSHFSFQEVLRLTTHLKLRQEFIRYADFGINQTLSDDKVALHAAVALTDARKYASAASYYEKWLAINHTKPVDYLKVLVQIEMGRLWYLSKRYTNAEKAFRSVLMHLNSDQLTETQKRQLLRNSEITYRMMARSFLKAKDIKLARKMYELTKADSSAPVNYLNDAQIAFASNDLESSLQLVHRFIAKQSNNSESYQLLLDIHIRNNGDEADNRFIKDLEIFRKKYPTGKVLDDYLVQFYIKTGTPEKAKSILERQRKDTLWRDRANRKLAQIALIQKNADQLLTAVSIEVDEHETLAAIRSLMNSKSETIASLEQQLTQVAANDKDTPRFVGALCLLLHCESTQLIQNLAKNQLVRIEQSKQLTNKQKIKFANLIGKECVNKRKYEIAVKAFELCLDLNQNARKQWLDQRVAFDALLSSSFCHCRLLQSQEAFFRFEQAEKVLRYSPSVFHMRAWLNLHFGRLNEAIVSYDAFLKKFDKSGMSPSLAKLVERVRLEMALTLVAKDKPEAAAEYIEQIFDRNPFGPDLDAFQRNNQKYKEQQTKLIEIIDGVKNGGPFALGRN